MLVGLVVGCSAERVPNSPTDVPSVSSLTDRASLIAEAQSLYADYVRLSNQVSAHSGEGLNRLKPYLTTEAYDREVAALDRISARGLRTSGKARLIAFEAQAVELADGSLTAYACVDFAHVRVLNENGTDVTPTGRVDRQTSVPSFVREGGRLVIAENGTWSGKSIC
jgi:hypothetical protein